MMERTQIERVSKALADETRLIIFETIAKQGGMNCSELVSLRGVTPATVSHHLKVLADAQLIECRRRGQFVYSNAVPGTMKEYARSLERIVRQRTGRKTRAEARGRKTSSALK
jgi:ArsR family transcriptional regulator, arsenate/arsenite/antimonite-responsive transcriptional repressor